jgi:anaerobic glycerol-3-phosphate dehydrogenase C subunit
MPAPLDPQRSRIQADLGGLIEGSIRCDDTFLEMYACDASIYQIRPLAVVRPAHTADVVACVKYAAENQIPVIPRGAGSNVAGSCLGAGLVLDLSYSMRQIESVGREDVTVQPGVVLGDLNRRIRPHGRMIGPDPSTRMVTTLGGVLSMNSSGSHWLRYGSARDIILRMQMVLADGEIVEFHSTKYPGPQPVPSERADSISRRVDQLLMQNRDLISEFRPKTQLNQAGYNVFDLYRLDFQKRPELDLTRLIAGSEGTLGIITEATLQTEPIARVRGVALLFFHRLESAAQAAVEIGRLPDVSACDLVDRRILSLARASDERFHRLIAEEAEAMLLCEFHASDIRSLQKKLEQLTQLIQRKRRLAFDVKTTTQKEQRDFYWRIIRRTVPILFKLRGDRRALPFVEDFAVPPERIAEFLQDVHRILNENEVTASVFSHTPQGVISVRPFLSLSRTSDLTTMQRLANQLFERVLDYGGTISASHGDGLSRTWFLRRQYGRLYNVMSEIKKIFDPQNIMNPGKIVGLPYQGLLDNLRRVAGAPALLSLPDAAVESNGENSLVQSSEPSLPATPASEPPSGAPPGLLTQPGKAKTNLPVLQLNLQWDVPTAMLAARNCNGCGRCRTTSPESRMCPMFRLLPNEEASPRSKANLMRAILAGELPLTTLAEDQFKEIADLCFHCHQCRLECPASVDIPKLMVEAKSQYYATNGLKLSDWLLTRLDWLYGLAGRVPMIANFVLKNGATRWLVDRLFGISQMRKLPLIESQTFLRWAQRNRLHRPSNQSTRKVVYFVDAYVNWSNVELGKAFVQILKHNGIEVLVPARQNISGMSLISAGSLTRAKRLAARNIEQLAEWVRQGYQIVTTEPSAALALRHEYLNLIDEEDTKLVADHTIDASSFLLQLHHRGELALDFSPINASLGYHLPCHQKALNTEIPALELLRLIPGLQVQLLDKGCSGMAGTYGLKRKNYLRSMRIGFSLINAMRSPEIVAGSTECSTCKIQMEQGTSKPTMHPLKILALAYGLMPELKDLLNRRSGERIVSK